MLEWIITHAPDDGFMYLQLADWKTSILETNGYQPLWAIILGPFGFVSSGETFVYVALGVYYASLLAIPFVVKKLYGHWWGLLALCIPALLTDNLLMELPLSCLVILIALKYRKPVINALLIYTRMDLFPLAFMLTPIKKWWKIPVYFLPWIIFNLIVFHTIIPDSMKHAGVPTSLSMIVFLLDNQYVLPLLALGILGCAKKYPVLLIQLGLTLALSLFRDAPFMWHYGIIPVIVILGFAEIHRVLKERFKEKIPAVAITILLILVSGLGIYKSYTNIFENDPYKWQMAIYNSKDVKVNSTKGAFNSGIQGFFSKQKVYNLDGVFNHDVAMTDYIIDFEKYIPVGYELIEVYETTELGDFGIYRKVKQ